MNRFETLAAINCSGKTEKKNGLTYLSWALAWDQFKRQYPDSYYTIYEGAGGCLYHTDGRTCWVKTGVTLVDGDFEREHIEYLPIMDFKNRSIPLDAITSMDANKAVQRSLTKAVARHGLGLYIYAGEDLPEGAEEDDGDVWHPGDPLPAAQKAAPAKVSTSSDLTCEICHKPITETVGKDGQVVPAEEIARITLMKTGKRQCSDCFASWRLVQRNNGGEA